MAASILANAFGTIIGLVCVPIYIRFIGIEAYGLVGIFYALQALISIFDLGLTTTITRELALAGADRARAFRARQLVRTLETVYWGVALLLALSIWALAPIITRHWIGPSRLSDVTVLHSLRLIAIAIALQWPFSFYAGGLVGLGRQVLLNAMSAILGTVRAIGAVLALVFISPTAEIFFGWQAIVGGCSTVVVALALWDRLPASEGEASFRFGRLREVGRFAMGVTAVSLAGISLTQVDKVVLSRILPLESFGYYALAGTLSAGLMRLVQPVYDAVFPRLTELATIGDRHRLTEFYHYACGVLATAVVPATMVLTLMAPQVLWAWTGDATTVARTSPLLVLLGSGAGIFGVLHMPWALQLAHRWTDLGVKVNLTACALYVPAMIILSHRYGAVGAAGSWLGMNVFSAVWIQFLMHRRLLPGELGRWYREDVLRPTAAAAIVIALVRVSVSHDISRWGAAGVVLLAAVLSSGATALSVPVFRAYALATIRARLNSRRLP